MQAEIKPNGQNRALRVCHVVASLNWLGGHGVVATRIIEGLARERGAGVSAEILPIDPSLPRPLDLLSKVKYLRTVVNTVAFIASLLARLPRYDVVHVYSAAYWSFVLAPAPAVLLAKLFGKPVILHYHSGEAEDHLRRWPLTTRMVLSAVDQIVVPSGYLVDVFARFGWQARAIFNPVDFSRYRFRERRPLRPVFLTNRLHEPLYNVACVLRAFARIQQRYPAARLTVAGDGSLRRELEELAKSLGLRQTTFCGRVAFDDMPRVYDEHDIFLNGTDIDNMPSSVTESFAAGVLVVTTDAGGIPYIVSHGQTGLMVQRNDDEAMAQSAIKLLEDAELAARIAGAAQQASRRFSWAEVGKEWIGLYQRLASLPTAGSGARGPERPRRVARTSREAYDRESR